MRPAALQTLAVCAGVVFLPHVVSAADSPSAVHVQGAMLPLRFEPRLVAGGTVYIARGTGYSIVVEPGGASLILGGGPVATEDVVVSLAFDPAVPIVPIPESRLRATASYLVGARADWRTDVPLYGRVRLPQAWPGIDVVFYATGRQLEYDLIVSPGASVDQVRLRFRGGDRVRLDERGDLLIATPAGTIRQQKPYAFQEVAPRSRFNIRVNQERFPDANGDRLLAEEAVSAIIEVLNGVAIVVERAMYRSRPGRPPFDAGHESAGVTSTSTRWFLAEGATTKGFFDLFILVANPGDVAREG